jgi:H+/gluconate symporter-like permease
MESTLYYEIRRKANMKKWYILVAILAAVALAIGCAPKPIPPAAISEIYAMSNAATIRSKDC